MTDRILLGKFGKPHGVRGEIRLWIYNTHSTTARPGLIVETTTGESITLKKVRRASKFFIAALDGFNDCDEVARLTNLEFTIGRDDLPDDLEDDEFYQIDMIGLPAKTTDDTTLGFVAGFLDNVATDVMVITSDDGDRLLVPMLKEVVVSIDLDTGVKIAPLDQWAPADEEE